MEDTLEKYLKTAFDPLESIKHAVGQPKSDSQCPANRIGAVCCACELEAQLQARALVVT